MRGGHKTFEVPKHQADATLSQAAPVQNTWYTVLDTAKNVRIYGLGVSIAVANETIETRVTVDGQVIGTIGIDCDFGDDYRALFRRIHDGVIELVKDPLNIPAFLLEGRSVKVEVRKITANGAGTLTARVIYGKY